MSQELLAGTAPVSIVAGEALTRGRCVQLNSSGQAVHTTAITQFVLGVVLEDCSSGAMALIQTVPGTVVTAMAGAALATIGVEVMPQAAGAGKVIAAAGATAVSCGVVVSTAAGDGSLFSMLLRPGSRSPANV